MSRHIFRAILSSLPTLIGVLTCVFLLTRLIPGDPAVLILGENAPQEQILQLRKDLGLDQPIHVQYFRYLHQIFQGDLGLSLRTERSVVREILDVLPYTVELSIAGIFVSLIVGVPIGVLSAKRRSTMTDYVAMTFASLGVSMPVFWTGILFTLLFSLYLGWLPAIGGGDPASFTDRIFHLILPATAIGLAASAITARMTRTSMLEVLQQDYIQTARAKGLEELKVLYKHALRNALIPVITVVGLNMGRLLGGTIVTEIAFARPGMGKVLVDAIYARDYPQVQGIVAFFAAMVILVNLLVDLAYSVADPRVELS
ncbi:MAG: ABC transporter permease [Deltaproteobacteria bacterium]|nr:ABC transporter permease [Deltaproteobacteria bacterium]